MPALATKNYDFDSNHAYDYGLRIVRRGQCENGERREAHRHSTARGDGRPRLIEQILFLNLGWLCLTGNMETKNNTETSTDTL